MIALDPRAQKALALAATAATWTRVSATTFRMPSQSTPGESYLVTPQMCSCKDSERHPERPCKHQIACSLVAVLLDMDASPPPSTPLSEAEVDALFARF